MHNTTHVLSKGQLVTSIFSEICARRTDLFWKRDEPFQSRSLAKLGEKEDSLIAWAVKLTWHLHFKASNIIIILGRVRLSLFQLIKLRNFTSKGIWCCLEEKYICREYVILPETWECRFLWGDWTNRNVCMCSFCQIYWRIANKKEKKNIFLTKSYVLLLCIGAIFVDRRWWGNWNVTLCNWTVTESLYHLWWLSVRIKCRFITTLN